MTGRGSALKFLLLVVIAALITGTAKIPDII
jgi:Sec-independent protein translocase protein TatA